MNDINRKWFRVWEKSHYPPTVPVFGVVLSMYSPHFLDGAEREANGPFTSAVTLGVFKHLSGKEKRDKHHAILFSMFPRSILSPAELIKHSRNLCHDYLNNSIVRVFEGCSPDFLVVPARMGEKSSLVSQIAEGVESVPVRRFYYENEGKSLDNMVVRALPRIEEGRIWVASNPMDSNEIRNMDEKFLATVSSYPDETTKATVWALCQAIIYLENYGVFKEEIYERERPRKRFYGP